MFHIAPLTWCCVTGSSSAEQFIRTHWNRFLSWMLCLFFFSNLILSKQYDTWISQVNVNHTHTHTQTASKAHQTWWMRKGLFHIRRVKETRPVVSDVNYFHHLHTHGGPWQSRYCVPSVGDRFPVHRVLREGESTCFSYSLPTGHTRVRGLLDFCPSWKRAKSLSVKPPNLWIDAAQIVNLLPPPPHP